VDETAAGYEVFHVPGTGALQVVRSGARSVVSRAFAASPLKLLTPRNHGGASWVYTATYGGGLVGGDALRLAVEVGPCAMTFLSTQASSKVYRSSRGASLELDATVHDGGLLVVMPDPIVCFAGSTYRQVQRFELGRAAGLVLVDWLSSGRQAAGERWAFDSYSGRTTICCERRLVLHDALSLCARDGDVAARMGRFEVIAFVALIGPNLRAHADRVVSRVAQTPISRRARLLVAASSIGDAGCIVRMAGVSVEEVGQALRDHLCFVPSLLGDNPWARKW
jgi:urease accessory protein